jgi:hypothetical protein
VITRIWYKSFVPLRVVQALTHLDVHLGYGIEHRSVGIESICGREHTPDWGLDGHFCCNKMH